MISHKTQSFRAAFRRLPEQARQQAHRAFDLFRQDPYHKSLHFKRIHSTEEIYSVRVGVGYRAVAWRKGATLIWFWIGSHADYEKLIAR